MDWIQFNIEPYPNNKLFFFPGFNSVVVLVWSDARNHLHFTRFGGRMVFGNKIFHLLKQSLISTVIFYCFPISFLHADIYIFSLQGYCGSTLFTVSVFLLSSILCRVLIAWRLPFQYMVWIKWIYCVWIMKYCCLFGASR